MDDPTTPAAKPVRIWDGAIRLVHWAIVLLFAVSWYTHRRNLEWHRYSGYALLTVVLFRIYWGFAGSETSRFRHFVKGPAAIAGYAGRMFRRDPATLIGHNPLGAVSVVLLLALLLAQCAIGLFVTDTDGLESGPLSPHVSFETSRMLAEWHGRIFLALEVLAALHVAAVLFYLAFKRDDLIGPMVTGRKRVAGDVAPLRFGAWWHAAIALAVAAAIVWVVVTRG